MKKNTLDTGIKLVKNVGSFNFGSGCFDELSAHITKQRHKSTAEGNSSGVVYLVDEFFKSRPDIVERLKVKPEDYLEFVETVNEPATDGIDQVVSRVKEAGLENPATIVGMGGGITMDTAKALANLLNNEGKAKDYQGWDLVKNPAVHKIGIPTLSGTGAETTRTCVMTNPENGLKLGMNSDFTVFDHIVLDPDLTATVPREQFFYTGMDAYLHCMESLSGNYRNAVGDAYSRETINLCRQVFLGDDMMNAQSRERLMVASYLGGLAIAASYVGLVHPFSAGLSVVLGTHHCIGNCLVMQVMDEFYPEAHSEFMEMLSCQEVNLPEQICRDFDQKTHDRLYEATIVHEKPLTNALGEDFKTILTRDKVREIFERI